MGEKRCCKRNKRKDVYCKCEGCNNKRNISQVKKISRDVFMGADIKKKIHKSKKHYDRKAQSELIID